MSMVELVMPRLGESIVEATILRWHKKPGDRVKMDEAVLDIATDKVDSEVPSSVDGVISEILFQENDVVPVGKVIARIRTEADEQNDTQINNGSPMVDSVSTTYPNQTHDSEIEAEVPYMPPHEINTPGTPHHENSIRFYSPLVLNIASSEGISMTELEKIVGTGQGGRVSKKDILHYLKTREQQEDLQRIQSTEQQSPEATPQEMAISTTTGEVRPQVSYSGNVEIIEMDRMRKMIAQRMLASKNVSAHVTSFAECDVTNLVIWRDKVKKDFQKRENAKLTFTPLFIEAIVKSIKKYPLLNSSVDGDKIIIRKDINIGMATALPTGNLIVPVIKGADQLNLTGLAKQVNHLADAARSGKLKPDDTADGTFTLTNIGTFGSIMGTPIINQPQVAILATGAIRKRPVVIETTQGDSIAVRHMMYLSLSYDHRIIDGALGATFLQSLVKEIENFDPERGW